MEIFRSELTEGQLESLESDYRQSRTVAYFNLNIERSRTILESISLFRFLRLRVLTDPNLSETVKNCRKMKELPFWWRSVHDRALLYGVDKHGLNNWEAIAEDPELGFPATLEKLAQKKQNVRSLFLFTFYFILCAFLIGIWLCQRKRFQVPQSKGLSKTIQLVTRPVCIKPGIF